jgi:prepilin-type N-terminal cleavage/methylation domain-containing protein/prepilin-type processing-associated H-X9-DG protein
MSRRRGFTLIELLVVIAIIAILAAMLFPVFARARESARKIQCLANVKNIATAVQMYLSDYDRFPPDNNDGELFNYLDQGAGRGTAGRCSDGGTGRYNGSNPYLRWPVIFDEYVKNRDVWRCPSIRNISTATWIVPSYTSIWWHYLQQNEGRWGQVAESVGCGGGPCCRAYPSGWGGTVTDSIAQQQRGGEDTGAFVINIGLENDCLVGRKTSEIQDPSWQIVCGDNQTGGELNLMFSMLYATACCWDLSDEDAAKFNYWPAGDPSFRSKYAPHLGGLNLGFADGHAAWWAGEAALANSVYSECCSVMANESDCYSEAASKNKFGFMCPYGEVVNSG